MAWIVGDSFDYYGAVADVARSVWDSVGVNFSLASTATRFGMGQKIVNTSSPAVILQKTVGTNEATVYAALAYYRVGALSGSTVEAYLQYRDGATAQCTVCFESGGNITLKSGGPTGTVLATYSGAFVQDVWTHFQIRVVIDGAAGSLTVRKNGQTSDTYASATTLNTRGGTANNYANVVALGHNSGATGVWWLDDFLVFSGSGAAPNTWVGDVRAVCLAPAADTAQKQFTPLAASITYAPYTATAGGLLGANTIRFTGFTAAKSGVISKMSIAATASTGNVQAALYAGDGAGGAPGTLLATSAVVTNPGTATIDFTFSSGQLVSGRPYYLAYLHDMSWNSPNTATGSSGFLWTQARTYASGFPATAAATFVPATTGPYGLFTLSGNIAMVGELLANGDTDYVYDSTVTDADLYDMDDLQFTPMAILGIVSKIYCKKSDAGSRNGQVLVKSGATQVAGADTVLGTTYTYLSRVDAVDPNTGAPWTLTGINALQVGQKVTA